MTPEEISLLKQKDEPTFDCFYNKYHKLFFCIIFKTIKNFQETEELVIDVFCKILEDLDQYRGGNFKYWCITIAKNMANMHLRKVIQERQAMEKYVELETSKANESDDPESLNEDLLKEMKTIVFNEYGLGLEYDKGFPYKELIGHSGSGIGTRTDLYYFPRQGMTIAILTNSGLRGANKKFPKAYYKMRSKIIIKFFIL